MPYENDRYQQNLSSELLNEIPFIDMIWLGEAIVKVKGRVRNCFVKIPAAPLMRKVGDEEIRLFGEKWQHNKISTDIK